MNVRNYPVPRRVSASAHRSPPQVGVAESAVQSARAGRVRGYHLPLLAGGSWQAGSEWAQAVLDRERTATDRRREALLAAAGYDPSTYVYQGVLDPGYPDHEMIVSVARQAGYDSPLEKWDGVDWGTAEVGPDGLEYLVLDQDVLADVLDAIDSGSAGVMLRPFEPRAWMRDAQPIDMPVLAAAPPPRNTDAMVAFPVDLDTARSIAVEDGLIPEELHVTLAYLGDVEENAIDYQALQRAVAKWARRMSDLPARLDGTTDFDTETDTANVALVSCDGIQEARELLVRLLEAEGVSVDRRHPTYVPHVTLAYDEHDVAPPQADLNFDRVGVYYGDDSNFYQLGEPVVAAGGAGPDIYYAIVDEFDTAAVLDLIRVLPGPIAYRRSGGSWVKDDKLLLRLMGVDPPPVVEVDASQAEDVLAQVDAYDAKNPEPAVTAAFYTEDDIRGAAVGVEAPCAKCGETLVYGVDGDWWSMPDGSIGCDEGGSHEPVLTAAGPWDEDKHPRAGGRFAKKNGGSAASPASTQTATKPPPKGPQRPSRPPVRGPLHNSDVDGVGHDGAGRPLANPAAHGARRPDDNAIRNKPWLALQLGNDRNHQDLDMGLGPEFWNKQPEGFRQWLVPFLRKMQAQDAGGDQGQGSDDGKGADGQRSGTANDGKRDVAKGDQRSSAQKDAQAKAAAEGGKKQGAANLAKWREQVPPKYRKAMDDFIQAVGMKADHPGQGQVEVGKGGQMTLDGRANDPGANPGGGGDNGEAARVAKLDGADRTFDNQFAKEGLGEARRREIFDRQIQGQAERLLKSGVDPNKAQRAMRHKIEKEKQQRDAFERRRRVAAEQERVRRLIAGNREAATQQGVTADASFMPDKLKKYWLSGEGAAKIRWNVSGDFNRCVRALGKYLMPGQIKGACANLHHLATGHYPGPGKGT